MTGPRQSIPEFPPNEEYGEHRVGTDAAERQSWASISRRIGESGAMVRFVGASIVYGPSD